MDNHPTEKNTIGEEAKKQHLLIELRDWNHTCGDGCCYLSGTDVFVNGEQLHDADGENIRSTLQEILEYLGYSVEIEVSYDKS